MRRFRLRFVVLGVALVASSCKVYGFGDNTYGQLGDGFTADRYGPTQTGSDSNWSTIVTGGAHTCGIRNDHTLWCWGNNDRGQVGDGTTTPRRTPTQVGSATDWKTVDVGALHSCAIRSTGTLWCWGYNTNGRLGDHTILDRHAPVQIGTSTEWKSVSAGYWHTCAVRTSGTLWCWGYNGDGELGNGTRTSRSTPTQVGTDTNWSTVQAGYSHSCAVRTTGTLWCWGWGALGQVGDGTGMQRTVPTQVGVDTNWKTVDAGHAHSCGVRSTGTLWCWGYNINGQLGDGSTTTRLSPVQIGTETTWDVVKAAEFHSCATRIDRSLWCWGENTGGQLGDGTRTRRLAPVRIGTGTDWSGITAAGSSTLGLRNNGDADFDGDRLPDWAETNTGVFVNNANTGTSPSAADTDLDGIDDGDETLGTLAGLNLPGLGANPLKKNILLEFDWFTDALDCAAHSHRPTAAAVTAFKNAFANAVVPNPDGTMGIDAIVDYGQGGVFVGDNVFVGGNVVADANGVVNGGVEGAEFKAYKAANFAANRQGYFHYVLNPHRYNTSSGSSGQAEINGDDLIVSLQCFQSTSNVANTIQHELGHNLGLRHGGNVNLPNYKPNYNSVMNYKYQFPGVDNNCTPPGDGVLSYSYGARLSLDEHSLDELEGTCGAPAWDWDGSGTITSPVTADINVDGSGVGDGSLQVLHDYNDWANLAFTGIVETDGAPAAVEVVSEQPVPAAARHD